MIRLIRSYKFRNGKRPAIMKWAKELADFINTKFSGANVQVFISRFGDINTIYWIGDFDDVPALDQWQQRLVTDAEYQAFIKKSIDQAFLVDGTIYDTVMETLP